MDVDVRVVGSEDWADVRAIRLRALAESPDAFGATLAEAEDKPESAWRDLATGPGPRLLAFSADRPVAMGGLYEPDEAPDAMVWGMWVDPAWRGRGLGSRILGGLLDRAPRPVLLQVSEGNEQALRFYEAHGFVTTGERRPLRDGSDVWVQTMRLRRGPDPV